MTVVDDNRGGQSRTTLRRGVAALATAALAGGATFFTVTTSAPAAAQSGKRVCGNVWHQDRYVPDSDDGKTVTIRRRVYARVFEVPKSDLAACGVARDTTDHFRVEDVKPEWLDDNVDWKQTKDRWKCESFGELLGGKIGQDPCILGAIRTMENAIQRDRTDSVFAVEWDRKEPSAARGEYPELPPPRGEAPGDAPPGDGPADPPPGTGPK